MIFVTVGTHEQQFNRLVKAVDELKQNGTIQDEVIVQSGYSTFEPDTCEWSKIIPYQEMKKNMENARIIITHGGPASFMVPLQIGKIPIVVPRQKQYDEHVNDHQVDFALAVSGRFKNIITIIDINELQNAVENYDQITASMRTEMKSNNMFFTDSIEQIATELLM